MARVVDPVRKLPLIPLVAGAVVLLLLIAAGIYFSRPAEQTASSVASAEAKAYLPNLALSNVSMQASENFMKQQVVEVKGDLANNGPKTLASVEVFCLFYDTSGREIHRERLPILSSRQPPLHPGEQRPFRLPFDALPDGWNQAMPRLVVAEIRFLQ